MSKILVVGAAGYIGSHMLLKLHEAGHEIIALDNLSTGHREAILFGPFVKGDINDISLLDTVFTENIIDTVMNFSGFISVGESMSNPEKYYRNNVVGTLNLLSVMLKHGVKKFVFSSTAAVYGNPNYTPLDLDHPLKPINPYGESKAFIETVLADYDKAYALKSVVLRYFNAAGADPMLRVGEYHEPETHLIPLVLKAAQERKAMTIFGDDYSTPDGTCIRDYIHVSDLCDAHLLALETLAETQKSETYNLGNGQGYSVKQVIDLAKSITGLEIPVKIANRRPGDPAVLVADAKKATQMLGWQPKYPKLESILQHAWLWEQKLKKQLLMDS